MKKFYLFAVLAIIGLQLNANNIIVTNATCTGQVLGVYTGVKFNLSWENSWRMSAGPANWDAAWVFVKYKIQGGNWSHASLSTTPGDHTIGNNGGTAMTFLPGADAKGVFIYRSANGTGNISLTDVILRWNYPSDGVADNANLQVQVFAVEMVYIPQGPFFIGDGNVSLSPSGNAFKLSQQAGNNMPYKVTSENAITLCSSTYAASDQVYDPLKSAGTVIPAGYPKGYQAFYMMKYEVSQKQYLDFFNTLPKNLTILGNRNLGNNGSYRNNFYWDGQVNNDAVLSPNNGGDRAQNYIAYADAAAYADWAALRPMSELEYEKASRGCDASGTPIFPTNLEFAWGNTTVNPVTALSNDGLANEGFTNPLTSNANCHYTTSVISGPVRCGIFAAKGYASNQRTQSGASYYGVMELSGNLAEIVLTVSNYSTNSTSASYQSKFTNVNGDGILSATTGNANNSNTWGFGSSGTIQAEITLGTSSYGVGIRGGSFTDGGTTYCQTSDRSNANYVTQLNSSSRASYVYNVGFRCVRTP